jgi:hypothetical protein
VLRVGCEEIVAQPGDPPADDPMTSTVPDGGRLRRYAEGLLGRPPSGPGASADFATDASQQAQPAAAQISSASRARSAELLTPRPAAGSPPPERSPSAPPNSPASRGLGASWRDTSWPLKLTLFLLPLAAAGILYTWDDPPEPSAPVRNTPRNAASTSAKASTPAAPASSLAELAPTASGAAPLTALPTPSGSVMVIGAASAAPLASTAPLASAVPLASTAPLASALPSSKVARAALEATFAGQLGPAQTLYEKLAAQHPEQPAFRSAADHVKAGTVRKP